MVFYLNFWIKLILSKDIVFLCRVFYLLFLGLRVFSGKGIEIMVIIVGLGLFGFSFSFVVFYMCGGGKMIYCFET